MADYSLVASNSDLNLMYNSENRRKVMSTGSLGPVNGPSGETSSRWNLEVFYYDQSEDSQPKQGIQKFENFNGLWTRQFTSTASVSYAGSWTKAMSFAGLVQSVNSLTGQVVVQLNTSTS